MADFGELDTAAHVSRAFREAFPQWRDLRHAVAERARYPEFDEQRALQQLLMCDLAQRITVDQDLGWLLIGSLALPARPAEEDWPENFRSPDVTDIPQPYVMPRSAFDLDLCASAVTDPDPDRAATLYREAVESAVRRAAAPPGHSGTAHGIGLGGLVRYTAGELNVFPNGQVMGIVTAHPVDPRYGPRHTPAVDDPIPIEIDIKPSAKVAVTGGPDTAHRPINALQLPGFAPFRPPLNPAVNQLADKLVLLTGKPRGLRGEGGKPWHRYKDVYDAYYMLQTCRIDADEMRQAVNNNWNLGPMSMEHVPVPYRFYGQDATGPEPVVPWKEGLDALRAGSPQLHRYPGWEEIQHSLGGFMDSVPAAPAGSTWIPRRDWTVQKTRTATDTERAVPGISAQAARSRSTTTSDGPRRKPPGGGPGAAPPAPGSAPREQRGRGHGR
jgi:hypothetical protein